MGTKFQFYKMNRVLEIDDGDGCKSNIDVFNITELCT